MWCVVVAISLSLCAVSMHLIAQIRAFYVENECVIDHPHWTLISGPLVDHPVAGSFWRMQRGTILGPYLFRPEDGNGKVISFSSQPFRARICLHFGVLSALLAAVFAKLQLDFYKILDFEHILNWLTMGFRTECH